VDSVNFAEDYFPQYRLMVSGLTRLQPRLTDHWFESGLLGYWGWMVAVVAGAAILLLGRWVVNRVISGKAATELGSPSQCPSSLPPEEVLLYSLAASILPLLMMTDLLSWVYDWFLPLQRIQFSWRWMGITAVTLPWLLGSLAGGVWPRKSWRNLILLGTALAVMIQVGLGWQVLGRTSFQPQVIQTFHTLSAAKQFPIEPQQRPGTPFLYWHWIFPDGLALVDVPEYRAHGVTFPMPPPSVDPLVRWQGNLGGSLSSFSSRQPHRSRPICSVAHLLLPGLVGRDGWPPGSGRTHGVRTGAGADPARSASDPGTLSGHPDGLAGIVADGSNGGAAG
jgi:hypothetical protein